MLVHHAVTSFEQVMPLEYSRDGVWLDEIYKGVDLDVSARSARFYWASLCAAGCVLASFGLMILLARSRRDGRRPRWLSMLLLSLNLSITVGYSIWIYRSGLHSVSWGLDHVLAFEWVPWLESLPLIAVVVTVATNRLFHVTANADQFMTVPWRRANGGYLHERADLLALLAGATLVSILDAVAWGLFPLPSSRSLVFEEFVGILEAVLLGWPEFYLQATLARGQIDYYRALAYLRAKDTDNAMKAFKEAEPVIVKDDNYFKFLSVVLSEDGK